jgi:membrane-associated phospholipid phosphatase
MRACVRHLARPRHLAGPAGRMPALAPVWAAAVAVAALTVGSLLAAVVWHARQLDPVDAWVMRWQQLVYPHGHRAAAIVSGTVLPVAVVTTVACAAVAWRAQRRDALVLALAAVPATLGVNTVLKQLVHRQRPGGPGLLYPSGHIALATAAALVAVLVVRVTPFQPRVRMFVPWLAGSFVLVIATARLTETVHALTDLVGGAATGLVVTLGAALTITLVAGRCLGRGVPAGPRRGGWRLEVDDAAGDARGPQPVVGGQQHRRRVLPRQQ